jgi:hypothetical protein
MDFIALSVWIRHNSTHTLNLKYSYGNSNSIKNYRLNRRTARGNPSERDLGCFGVCLMVYGTSDSFYMLDLWVSFSRGGFNLLSL